MAEDWALQEAFDAELRRATARIRRSIVLLFVGGLIAAVASYVALDAAGAYELGVATLVGLPLMIALIGRRYLQKWSGLIEASLVYGSWVSREGLVDGDGRLTIIAKRLMAAHDSSLDAAGNTSDPGERDRVIALSAYVDAWRRWHDGGAWLEPFQRAVEQVEMADARATVAPLIPRLQLSRIAWLFVGPLAAIGFALLVLSLLAMASAALR